MSARKEGGLRQRMAWLHTWGGLWFCWLAFAIFFTGTLSVFTEPLTHWMEPEHPPEPVYQPFVAPSGHGPVLEHSLRYLREHAAGSPMWEIWPRAGEDSVMVYWLNAQGHYADVRLSSATGAVLPPAPSAVRDTAGGKHFITFHHALHAGTAGLWIVGAASAAMLVALISGVITHKRIFKDFFTFRPAKGQRSWLDAHNLLGVLTLPFLFVIVYSGLAISWPTYMPVVRWAQELGGGAKVNVLDYGPAMQGSGTPAVLAPLAPMVLQAEAALKAHTHAVVVNHPGDASMTVQVYGSIAPAVQQRHLLSTRGIVEFDGVSGALRKISLAHAATGNPARTAMRGLDDLHRLQFAGAEIRWLYFVSGMAGSAMMAAGAILFMVKRRQKSLLEFGARTPQVYRMVEVLNVSAIAGLALACIAYLWGNRLIPVGVDERHEWEIAVFFLAWLATLPHAAMRPVMQAWREQLYAAATLCLLLPLLNAVTTGQQVFVYMEHGDWERGGVELVSLAFGLLLASAARRVQGKPANSAATRQRAAPTSAASAAAAAEKAVP